MTTALTHDQAMAAITGAPRLDMQGVAVLAYCGLTVSDIASTPPEALVGAYSGSVGASEPHRRALEPVEARAVLESARTAGPRDAAIVGLALACGLRQVEIRRLRTRDMASGSVRVHGKGGKWREVPVPARLWADMEAVAVPGKPDEPVFRSEAGAALSGSGIRDIIYRHLRPAVPGAVAHDLRHTCLTWMLRLGAGLEEAMEVAGHDEVSSHEVYAAASDAWVLREWKRTHPLGCDDVLYLEVQGAEFSRRMMRGVRRTVMVPAKYGDAVREALGRFTNERQVVNLFYRKGAPAPSHMRTAGAVHMTGAGAHPFLVGLMLGVSPATVVSRKLERMSERAGMERRRAVELVSGALLGDAPTAALKLAV